MEESCLLMRMLLSGLLANGGSQEQPGLPLAWLKMYEVQALSPYQNAVGPGCHLG